MGQLKTGSTVSNNIIYTSVSSIYIGTTLISFSRSSGSQTLIGVSIDGNAATANVATSASSVTWSNVSGKPNTISGYGITDAITTGTYNSFSPTLTGSGASGTWSINITGNAATANVASSVTWSNVSGKPTTISGYGITDINSYAPTLTGSGASGNWSINITGNAATASSASSVTWSNVSGKPNIVNSLNGQIGDITNTTFAAIGSYITGRPANYTSYPVNSIIDGSSLYATPSNCLWSLDFGFYVVVVGSSVSPFNATLVSSGTWRCMSPALNPGGYNYVGLPGLWVRIS